ncbi:MAG: hypothetical protein ICV66_08440 [Chitinophagaceae bacterium]|nr:hypothetical protein [Chitinophagaceae bacterium]
MARIFSISFLYNGMPHNAMISVQTTPSYKEFHISMMDEDLAELLPQNKIISIEPDHYVFKHPCIDNKKDLMEILLDTVSKHMQTIQA